MGHVLPIYGPKPKPSAHPDLRFTWLRPWLAGKNT